MRQISVRGLLDLGVRIFLLDASGVLYVNRGGVVPGVHASIDAIRDAGGEIFVVTNNTSLYVDGIARYLADVDIHLAPERILSSGMGLIYDSVSQDLIQGKKAFVYGWEGSDSYLLDAGAEVVEAISDADVVVMMASLKDGNDAIVEEIVLGLRDRPHVPLLCANPDRYVQGPNGTFPVIGYFAEEIGRSLGRDVHWVGKPEDNFSVAVGGVLQDQFGISMDDRVCFMDDNYENTQRLSQCLGIHGCLVLDTGLSKGMAVADLVATYGSGVASFIPSLGVLD